MFHVVEDERVVDRRFDVQSDAFQAAVKMLNDEEMQLDRGEILFNPDKAGVPKRQETEVDYMLDVEKLKEHMTVVAEVRAAFRAKADKLKLDE